MKPILTIKKKIEISLNDQEWTKANTVFYSFVFNKKSTKDSDSEEEFAAKILEKMKEIQRFNYNGYGPHLFSILIDIYQDGTFKLRLPEQ